MRFFLALFVAIALTISCILSSQYVEALEQYRYKVCTVDELRKSVEDACMRISTRDGNSGLQLGPYGSVSPAEIPLAIPSDNLRTAPLKLTDTELVDILKASAPYVRGNKKRSQVRQQPREARMQRHAPFSESELCDYLDTCCNRSCVIDPMDLAAFCVKAR